MNKNNENDYVAFTRNKEEKELKIKIISEPTLKRGIF